jgi:hypothetical protein
MFQNYTDQTRSFEGKERDQNSPNNEECIEKRV